jgi:hypothetical protein
MPEFIMNEAGAVTPPGAAPLTWQALDDFTQGYIEALFFTDSSPAWDKSDIEENPAQWASDCAEGVSDGELPGDSEFGDISPESLARILGDCAKFQSDNAATLDLAYESDYDETQAGRDFWYTRNGHGVGFWDREQLAPDRELWNPDGVTLEHWTPAMDAKRLTLTAESPGILLSNAAEKFGAEYPCWNTYARQVEL